MEIIDIMLINAVAAGGQLHGKNAPVRGLTNFFDIAKGSQLVERARDARGGAVHEMADITDAHNVLLRLQLVDDIDDADKPRCEALRQLRHAFADMPRCMAGQQKAFG